MPRNEYGNVYLFKKCMLPPGTVHLQCKSLLLIPQNWTRIFYFFSAWFATSGEENGRRLRAGDDWLGFSWMEQSSLVRPYLCC